MVLPWNFSDFLADLPVLFLNFIRKSHVLLYILFHVYITRGLFFRIKLFLNFFIDNGHFSWTLLMLINNQYFDSLTSWVIISWQQVSLSWNSLMQLSGSTSIIRLFTKPHWNLKILRSLLIEPTTISHAIYDKYNENYADYECTT